MPELGEELFDQVEIRAVRRREDIVRNIFTVVKRLNPSRRFLQAVPNGNLEQPDFRYGPRTRAQLAPLVYVKLFLTVIVRPPILSLGGHIPSRGNLHETVGPLMEMQRLKVTRDFQNRLPRSVLP